MKLPIYLDYSSTTPVDPRVARKMIRYLTIRGIFGNSASGSHRYGWEAKEAIDMARINVATLINANPKEIIFTSGATEANNLAIKGVAYASKDKGKHIITSVIEHKTVIDSCKKLEKDGFLVTWLIPSSNGIVTPDQLKDALREDTILVTLMHVNNEIGTIQDIKEFGVLCRQNKTILHVDAAQSVGKLPIDLSNLKVDLMTLSSHKIYGPKGVGALFIRNKPWINIEKQIHGGNHERGLRSGTLPTHQIVGMGEAYLITSKSLVKEINFLKFLKNRLYEGLNKIDEISVNGDMKQSVANIINLNFKEIESDNFIVYLKDLAVSTGSACTSENLEPSYVLRAIGLSKHLAYNSIRFSFGRFTTIEEIDFTIHQIQKVIKELRKFKL